MKREEGKERDHGHDDFVGTGISGTPLSGNGTWGRHTHDHKWAGDSGPRFVGPTVPLRMYILAFDVHARQ